MAKIKKLNKADVVESLRNFFNDRDEAKRLEEQVKKDQPEVITLMKAVDPDNKGIVWDENDPSKGTAFVQQNDGSEVWDTEAIIDWAKEDKARWMSVSSRVFDPNKFEAEIANGNISAKVANKFKMKTKAPAPFIRRGKKGKESI